MMGTLWRTCVICLVPLLFCTAHAHTGARAVHTQIINQGNGAIVLPGATLVLQADAFDHTNTLRVRTPHVRLAFEQLSQCLAQGLWRQHSGTVLYVTCPPESLGALVAHPYVIERQSALLESGTTSCLSTEPALQAPSNSSSNHRPDAPAGVDAHSKHVHPNKTDPFADLTDSQRLRPCAEYHAERFVLMRASQSIVWKIQLLNVQHPPRVWSTTP